MAGLDSLAQFTCFPDLRSAGTEIEFLDQDMQELRGSTTCRASEKCRGHPNESAAVRNASSVVSSKTKTAPLTAMRERLPVATQTAGTRKEVPHGLRMWSGRAGPRTTLMFSRLPAIGFRGAGQSERDPLCNELQELVQGRSLRNRPRLSRPVVRSTFRGHGDFLSISA